MSEANFRISPTLFCGLNGERSRETNRRKKYGLFKTLDELRQVCLYGRPRSNRLSRIPDVLFATTVGPELQNDSQTMTSFRRLASARSDGSRPFTPRPQTDEKTDKNFIQPRILPPIHKGVFKGNSQSRVSVPLEQSSISQLAVKSSEPDKSTKFEMERIRVLNLNGNFPPSRKSFIDELVLKSDLQISRPGNNEQEEQRLIKEIDELSSMLLHQKLIQLDIDRQIALLKFYCQRLTSNGDKPSAQNRASQKLPYLFRNLKERVINQVSLFIEEYEQLAPKVAKNIETIERISKKPSLLRKVLQDQQNKDQEKDLCYLEDLLICISSGIRYIERSKSQLASILDEVVNDALKSAFETHISKFLQTAKSIFNFNILQSEVELQILRRKWLPILKS